MVYAEQWEKYGTFSCCKRPELQEVSQINLQGTFLLLSRLLNSCPFRTVLSRSGWNRFWLKFPKEVCRDWILCCHFFSNITTIVTLCHIGATWRAKKGSATERFFYFTLLFPVPAAFHRLLIADLIKREAVFLKTNIETGSFIISVVEKTHKYVDDKHNHMSAQKEDSSSVFRKNIKKRKRFLVSCFIINLNSLVL